ncbi:MAG: metallophosphoesterase family protein, partial [Myxococcota bacterium]
AVALHTGDLVGMGSSPQQWDNFFAIEQPLLSSVPLYPAIGNHEEDGKLYVEAFELPEDSPHPERCYTFSYATAWFAVLDVYTSPFGEGSEQLAWIEKELETASKRPEIRHRIVMAHHGPFDSGMHGSNMEMREQLVPLFERYGVDMVFTGHNHHYERSTVNGIKYVVTGGSGAPLRDVQGDWWTEKRDSVLHYITLDMHGAWLRFEAKKLDGSELDGFELGRDVYECEADSDCAGSERGVCEDGFEPRWACARSACVPDCVYAPPSEDEGVGLTWE